VHTAWIKPDYEYEEKTISFIESIVDFGGEGDFMRSFLSFQRKLAYFGIFNSLSQTLLKITSPGVPDFYQGTELWDLSMVDPDNRRPVDFSVRAACLNRIMVEEKRDMHSLIRRLWDSREDGEVKLFLIYRALKARNLNHALFQSGGYLPLYAEGRYRDCVIAYARMFEGDWAITIAPRFLTSLVKEDEMPLGAKWEDTRIVLQGSPPSTWKDAVTGQIIRGEGEIMIGGALNRFPAALLLGTVSV
jgi:(1->4)-alpha-D-glucan 1-alpha-D-glucosylmutase